MKKRIPYIIAFFGIAGLIYFTLAGGESAKEYEASVFDYRGEKEDYLRTNSGSPFALEGEEAGSFSYFPVNKKYKVVAKVEKIQKRQISIIQNNDGSSQRYLKYAWLQFELEGSVQKLLVLKPLFGSILFLGFADDTSGDTSYGGGRYLDIGEIKGDRATLDFNLAYNPYCAYSEKFQCPFPPKENILAVRIEAGEKDYEK
ncbi:MAG: DUF1684 domain-containing protein [Cytophagales bacterium]|nr:DUF1684 domain-containing protein [Cytophagales bacterium]